MTRRTKAMLEKELRMSRVMSVILLVCFLVMVVLNQILIHNTDKLVGICQEWEYSAVQAHDALVDCNDYLQDCNEDYYGLIYSCFPLIQSNFSMMYNETSLVTNISYVPEPLNDSNNNQTKIIFIYTGDKL